MRKGFLGLALFLAVAAWPAAQAPYYPPAGQWERKTPAEVGMDAARLNDAVQFMKSHEAASPRRDFSDQEIVNGKLLASIPTERAGSNGVVVRGGYIVAEWGDAERPDPTYSVAKSMLSTIAGIALDRGLVGKVDDPVAALIKDGGYDSPQNSRVTWRHHLQQESEWEGEMFGKNANFIGAEAFGRAERTPRSVQAPGSFYEYNDVRINRFSLSLLRIFKKPLPDVFRDEVMNPIGASSTWKWVPYTNAYVDIDGKRMASVSGGTRWGGRQIVSPAYVKMATTPSAHGPDYGFLWWLNTKRALWPGSPADAYRAVGQGGNIILISPSHDLVVVWRWSAETGEGFRRVVAAITS